MNKLLLTLIISLATTQALGNLENLLDGFNIRDEAYKVVLDEVEDIDATTAMHISVGRKKGDLVAQFRIYNTKETEISPGEKFNLYIFSELICREYGENSKSLINPKGSGYKLDRILAGVGKDYYLSEDKKDFHFECNVMYFLEKS